MKLEELCAAVQEARYYNERFTRREYTSAFRTYTERFGPLYMEAVRETAEDPDGRRVLAEQLLDLLEAGWKRQRPWNRTMVQAREKQMLVTYLSPMLLGLEEPLCQELAERLGEHPPAQGHLQHHHLCPAAGGLPQCDPGHRHHRLAEASGRGELNRAPARKRKNLPGNGKNMKKLFDNRAHIPYNTIRVITR